MSWKEIEVKDVDELNPDGKYRVKVGETWWKALKSVGGGQWLTMPREDHCGFVLKAFIESGCPIEEEVDDGTVMAITPEEAQELRAELTKRLAAVEAHFRNLWERSALKPGDVVLRAGEFRKVNTYTPGYCFEDGVSAYIVKEDAK